MNTYKREYDRDILYDLFINQNMSAQKIANKYNVPRYIIERDLKNIVYINPKTYHALRKRKALILLNFISIILLMDTQ